MVLPQLLFREEGKAVNNNYMGNTTKKAFPVLNMHCAGCANNVEKTVKKLPGVIEASVNFATNTLTVSYEKEQLTPGEIRAAVLAAGYDLIVEEAHKEERREEEQHKRYTRLKWKVIGAWILVVPLLVYSMILMHVPYSNEIQWYLLSLLWSFSEVVSSPELGNRLN